VKERLEGVFMYSLLSYGEVLVEFLPSDNGEHYYPMAGGAPANVAVAYAKLGGDSYFAGGISNDNFGEMLYQELTKNNVGSEYVYRVEQANTALVLVSLAPDGERSFNFYRHNTADTLYGQSQIAAINWQGISIFHYCSNTLTNKTMNDNTAFALKCAKKNNVLVSFDVNIRQQLWSDLSVLAGRIDECIKVSDLVKLSKEEAEYLAKQAGTNYHDYIKQLIAVGVTLVIVTDGAKAIHVTSSRYAVFLGVPTIKAIDTTAAGDSFVASFLFSLSQQTHDSTLRGSLEEQYKVTEAINFAAKCGAYTCQRKGAFAALPYINDI